MDINKYEELAKQIFIASLEVPQNYGARFIGIGV